MANAPVVNVLYTFSANPTGVVNGCATATNAMNGMVNNAQQVNRKLATSNRGIFNNTAQTAFALQDTITVLAMGGGLSRALLSAANNMAFIASAAGTMGGALASVGITLAAAFLPQMFAAATATKSFRDNLDALKMSSDRVAASVRRAREEMQFKQTLEQEVAGGASGLQSHADAVAREIEVARAGIAERQRGIDQIRRSAQNAQRIAMQQGFGSGGLPDIGAELMDGQTRLGTTIEQLMFGWTGGFFGGMGGKTWAQARADELSKEMEEMLAAQNLDLESQQIAIRNLVLLEGKLVEAVRDENKEREHAARKSREQEAEALRRLQSPLTGTSVEIPQELLGFGGAVGFAAAHAQVMNRREREMAQLEQMKDLHAQILDLQTRQVSLVMKGTPEHANEMARLRQVAFDAGVNGLQQEDASMRRAIDRLNNALANGVRFVPVR